MDPLVVTAAAVGSLAAVATAIANWRLGRQSTREAQAVRDEAEQRAAVEAGLRFDGDRWRGQRRGRDVSVEFAYRSTADTFGQNFEATGHIACTAQHRATFQLDDADVVSDLRLDISIDDATIDPFVRVRGSDPADVRALFSSPVRAMVRNELTDNVRVAMTTLRVSEGGNNQPVRLPRFRRLWLDDDGLHVEWHCNRIGAHTRTSLAAFTVDYLAELAEELEVAMTTPAPLASTADAATGAHGSAVAVRPF
jgi:hypothetical protein